MAVLGAMGLILDYRYSLDSPAGIPATQELDIPRGMHVIELGRELAQHHAVSRPHWFMLQAYLSGKARQIKYGTYELKPGMTLREILTMLTTGNVKQYPVMLVEGWTLEQVRTTLQQHSELQHTLMNKSMKDIMLQIDPQCQEPVCNNPEGWFYPSTYHVTKGTPDIEVLKRAHLLMKSHLARVWEQRVGQLPYDSPYEVLKLASIVEKETADPSERPAIAGVFIRRLQKGMRLQTDPTVIYGLGKRYNGDITLKDLRTDTPYNTYTRSGLPPTPIAMPSKNSLEAVINPDQGKSLYFVARGDGTHAFSETLDQHNQAVDLYQRHNHVSR